MAKPKTSESTAPARRSPTAAWPWACALLAVGLAAYANSFWGPFIFDDISSITLNPTIRSLTPISNWFNTDRSLGLLTFALNYAAGELNVRGYHVVNLLIHLAAALVLFGLISRTLRTRRLEARYRRVARPLAFSIAVLWLVHPLQTESVTYIAQRFESLMGLLFLLTMYCFVRATDSRRPWSWYIASLAACAAGERVKEVMIAAPAVVLWYDWAFLATNGKDLWRRRAYYAALCLTTLVLMGPTLFNVTSVVTPQLSSVAPVDEQLQTTRYSSTGLVKGISPLGYLSSQPGVILTYLKVVFYPSAQCFDYGHTVPTAASEIWPAALAILGLLAATLWSLAKHPAASFLGGWFFLILAPSSSIIPLKDLAVEHRMYLPLAAVLTAVVIAGYELWQAVLRRQSATQESSLLNSIGAIALIAGVATLGWQTWLRNADYQDDLRLWQDTVDKAPHNLRAHYSVAHILLERGNYAGAIQNATTCVDVDPTYVDAYHVRGVAHAEQDDFAAAIEDFSTCLQLDPAHFKACHDRGLAYQMTGQLDKALADFDELIKLAPVARSYLARAAVHSLRGDHRPAIADIDLALQQTSPLPDAYRRRAESHFALGDYRAAWSDVRLCISSGGFVPATFLEKLRAAAVDPKN